MSNRDSALSRNFFLAALLLATTLLTGLIAAAPVSWLDAWLGDFRTAQLAPTVFDVRKQAEGQAGAEIVIVTIDERSIGELPWRDPVDRAFLADLLFRLEQKGAAAIGLYVPLDRSSEAGQDKRLRAALTRLEVPLTVLRRLPRPDHVMLDVRRDDQKFQEQMLSGVPSGHDLIVIDERIGSPRSLPEAGGLPFAVAFASVITGKPPVPLPRSLQIMAPRGPNSESFTLYSAGSIATLPEDALKDRIVLVGKALEDTDYLRTPFATLGAGPNEELLPVELQAHALTSILGGQKAPLTPSWISPVLVFCAGMLGFGVIALVRFSKLRMLLLILLVGGYSAGAIWIEMHLHLRLAPLSPPLALLAAALATTSFELLSRYNARRRLVHGLAGRLPKVQHGRAIPHALALSRNGVEKDASVLISSLRNFDRLPRGKQAPVSLELLQVLAHRQRQLVWRHGGMILSHRRGGVTAVFGGFGDDPRHAEHAVACAEAIERYGRETIEGILPPALDEIAWDVGVSSGPILMGDVGGEDALEYEIAGPAIRMAEILCRRNAALGCRISVSADCAKSARASAEYPTTFRPVADLVWPASGGPVRVVEPVLHQFGEAAISAQAHLKSYREAFHLLEHHDGSQQAALTEIFRTLLHADPDDGVVALHLNRLVRGEKSCLIRLNEM